MEETREQELTRRLFAISTPFEEIFTCVKAVTFHQDQLADTLTDRELLGLGILIKVAGFHGIDVTIRGKCGETLEAQESGENSKEATSNMG